MKLTLLFFLLLNCKISMASSPVDLLFKARGLQAIEKLDSFKNKFKSGKKLSVEEQCNYNIEVAYSMFAIADLRELIYLERKSPNGKKYISYKLNLSNEADGGAEISFNYTGESEDTFLSTEIENLKSGWAIVRIRKEPDSFGIHNGKCTYLFKDNNPLSGVAISSN